MTEKKTFKNPTIEMELDGAVWVVTDDDWPNSWAKQFRTDEWDMEVTFTKKVKPKVDGTATLELYPKPLTIVAISDDRVWLQDPDRSEVNFVRRFDQLQNVKPWQPA